MPVSVESNKTQRPLTVRLSMRMGSLLPTQSSTQLLAADEAPLWKVAPFRGQSFITALTHIITHTLYWKGGPRPLDLLLLQVTWLCDYSATRVSGHMQFNSLSQTQDVGWVNTIYRFIYRVLGNFNKAFKDLREVSYVMSLR